LPLSNFFAQEIKLVNFSTNFTLDAALGASSTLQIVLREPSTTIDDTEEVSTEYDLSSTLTGSISVNSTRLIEDRYIQLIVDGRAGTADRTLQIDSLTVQARW
jgi:hypothetical protein